MSRKNVLLIGMVFLLAADVVLGCTRTVVMLAVGAGLWGLNMAFTQGLLAAMVADTTPAELRGTAYGILNLVSGLALLAASVIAGILWDEIGSTATFLAGAAFSTAASLAVIVWIRSDARPRRAH